MIKILAYALILIQYIQSSKVMAKARVSKARILGATIGDGVRIKRGAVLKGHKNISIGSGSFIGENAVLVAYGEKLIIGERVLIAEGAYISTRNHRFRQMDTPIIEQGYKNKPVIIGDDVWIAWGAAVLAGSSIPSHTVVAAGAVYQNSDAPTIQRLCVEVEKRSSESS